MKTFASHFKHLDKVPTQGVTLVLVEIPVHGTAVRDLESLVERVSIRDMGLLTQELFASFILENMP